MLPEIQIQHAREVNSYMEYFIPHGTHLENQKNSLYILADTTTTQSPSTWYPSWGSTPASTSDIFTAPSTTPPPPNVTWPFVTDFPYTPVWPNPTGR